MLERIFIEVVENGFLIRENSFYEGKCYSKTYIAGTGEETIRILEILLGLADEDEDISVTVEEG